jgi:hypothetical protein
MVLLLLTLFEEILMQPTDSKLVTGKDLYHELERRVRERVLGHIHVLLYLCGICLIVVTVILGVLLTKWLDVRMQNNQETYAPINITREQYETALAMWKSQNIAEYEITTETKAYMGGISKMRVSDGGKNIVVFESYFRPDATPRPPRTPEPDLREYWEVDTIEGMFTEVEAMLNQDIVLHTPTMSGNWNFYMSYKVFFHPQLGYPTFMSGNQVAPPGGGMTHANWEKAVTDFKILRRISSSSP